MIHDIEADKLIKKAAESLKEKMQMPAWAVYVKTGVNRERPPEQSDWWFIRAASILRRIYLDGPVGVERLKSYYGGLHRRGHKQAHFAKAGGKIIRTILKDLEKLNFVEKVDKPKKGRKITKEGIKFLNQAAKK
ncbi:MAG: 30S ribosomal protein S19e [Candidatus Aenigmatarchaeota archaeon]